ncbi:hypothetical protein AB0D35_14025 [Streptomyces sp. NPDC048301]|uniref:hypothetical protein n=1 Tax=Streptomyces sp. NPDC048301 TaxID=3155631 RepID=UPI0034164364
MLWNAIAPSRGYTKAANELVRTPRLSSDAKILLLYVQGLPDDRRDAALSEHARALGITGRAYQKAKKLLLSGGYLHERRKQGGRGFWTTEQLLSNVPLTPEEATGARAAGSEISAEAPVVSPGERYPTVGEPGSRDVGGQKPEEEERGKNTSHPPTEPHAEETGPEPSEAEAAAAERVLLSLRHAHRSLRLGVPEARKLVKLAVVWLRRGVTAAEMRRVLTGDLPGKGVRSAVGFLRHRLMAKMPEEPAPVPPPVQAPPVPPLRTCATPGDEHLFRPVPGEEEETLCGPCRLDAARAVWAEKQAARIAAEEAELRTAGHPAAAPAVTGPLPAGPPVGDPPVADLPGDDVDVYAHTPWRERVAALHAEAETD